MASRATVVDGDRVLEIDARAHDDTLLLAPDDLEPATGWELRREGLCRGNVCVPVRDRSQVEADGRVDLRGVADALRRPFAFESDGLIAVVGDAAEERAAESASLRAPDFTLPDIDGTPIRMSDFAGKKRLLIAWATW